MRRNTLRLLLPLLLLTPATITLAQDSPKAPKPGASPVAKPAAKPKPAPPSIWAKSARRVRVRTIKAQLGDIEAKRAADDAERLRRRAACLLATADEIDKAAKRLDRAKDTQRDDAFDAVDEAADLAEECENGPDEAIEGDIPEARSKLTGANIPELEEYEGDFETCYDEALSVRPNLAGVTRFMVRLGDDEHAGEVQRLRVEQDTVDDQDLLECQAEVIRNVAFPDTLNGKTVRFAVKHTPVKPK